MLSATEPPHRTAVVTVVQGRHGHLAGQLAGLALSAQPPDLQVVVAMGDPGVAAVVGDRPWPVTVEQLDVAPDAKLPLATARNRGAEIALADGADLLVFLDVDCIPGPALIGRYRRAAAHPAHSGSLLAGPVCYLPPAPGSGYDLARLPELAQPHPARPAPADGEVVPALDRRLFWSLSFAVTGPTWRRIGGFWPGYVGYGAEDTDLAETAHAAGVGLRWVGGAVAYHQHHPVSRPPVEHLASIIDNAHRFHRRWGWWPMTGWLEQFRELGLAHVDAATGWVAGPDPALVP